MANLPASLFAHALTVEPDSVAARIPRKITEGFEIFSSQMEGVGGNFLIAYHDGRPSLPSSRAIVRALEKVDPRPVAIASPHLDTAAMKVFSQRRIAYIRDEGNAYLPFLGASISPVPSVKAPSALSPHAQRIALNLISGRWDGFCAGDLAEAAGVSRSTISFCLEEIEAVLPSAVSRIGKKRIISACGMSKEQLLDAFEPFFSSPIVKKHSYSSRQALEDLAKAGALLSGESALPYFSDLAHDDGTINVAIYRKQLPGIVSILNDKLVKTEWLDAPSLVIEEWSYDIDGRDPVSQPSTGFDSLDALSLYVELMGSEEDDERFGAAIEQLREAACRE